MDREIVFFDLIATTEKRVSSSQDQSMLLNSRPCAGGFSMVSLQTCTCGICFIWKPPKDDEDEEAERQAHADAEAAAAEAAEAQEREALEVWTRKRLLDAARGSRRLVQRKADLTCTASRALFAPF
jgi:uncharacterized protein (DUF2461 family)